MSATSTCFISDIVIILFAAVMSVLGAVGVLKETPIYIIVISSVLSVIIWLVVRFLTGKFKRNFFKRIIKNKDEERENKNSVFKSKETAKKSIVMALSGSYKMILPLIAVAGVVNLCYKITSVVAKIIVVIVSVIVIALVVEFLYSRYAAALILIETEEENNFTEDNNIE